MDQCSFFYVLCLFIHLAQQLESTHLKDELKLLFYSPHCDSKMSAVTITLPHTPCVRQLTELLRVVENQLMRYLIMELWKKTDRRRCLSAEGCSETCTLAECSFKTWLLLKLQCLTQSQTQSEMSHLHQLGSVSFSRMFLHVQWFSHWCLFSFLHVGLQAKVMGTELQRVLLSGQQPQLRY